MENNVKIYKEYLLAANQKINLVSRRSAENEIDLHIEDSLKIFDHWTISNQQIVDIGSGAGFPGLIMAVADVRNQYTLLESDLKKHKFLEEVSVLLKLQHVQVIRDRAENIGQQESYREKFDAVTSRGVAAMRVVLEYCLPLVRVGGAVFLWKGPRYKEEMEEAGNALQLLGGRVEEIHLYNIGSDRQRAILQVRKIHSTPEKYPRRTGLPNKRPL
jgi:16S rRNA (guanine527-N7)-methyltransferase